MSKVKVAFFVFVLVSVLDIVGIVLKIPSLIFMFKPLILLSLLVLYVVSVSKRNRIYIIALIFSFLGDVFLLFSGELNFIIGLISFLIAHLIFIKIVINRIQKTPIVRIMSSAFLFFLVFSLLIFILRNSLGELLIPVIIYGLVISTFGAVSLIDYLNTNSKKALLMLIGASVFIVSDAVLAVNKFYESAHIFEVIIMITYVLAQYLIYRSMILEKNKV
tara:strand:+ start:80308 stop:80964 length:657 start_codon:yes stop_codon:yes gene_type:complete